LLGLAAFASSRQEINLAMGLYSRALSLDPSNALAKTAISSLAPLGTPAEQERELRRLDSQNPNVAPLVFALGNFYASQSRWTDAQRYYFKALQLAKSDSQSGSSISPDYAFNLAVSLEQLNQSGPALIFYEEALALATRFPANFDLSIARSRLESLSRKSSP
jgi:tetratricopeptide (TPR) repeat protein